MIDGDEVTVKITLVPTTGVPEPHSTSTEPCAVCEKPVDLGADATIYPNGRVAHIDCYNRVASPSHSR